MERAESKDFEGVASEAGRFLYEILFEWLMGREPLSVRLLLQIGWFKLSIEEWCAFFLKNFPVWVPVAPCSRPVYLGGPHFLSTCLVPFLFATSCEQWFVKGESQ